MSNGLRTIEEYEKIQQAFLGKTIVRIEAYESCVIEFYFSDSSCVKLETSPFGEWQTFMPAKIHLEEITS